MQIKSDRGRGGSAARSFGRAKGGEKLDAGKPKKTPGSAVPPADVVDFIRATFRSVWALELLLLLRRHRERSLTHDEMVGGLRGSDLIVRQSVESLAAAGLILPEVEGAAQYSTAAAEMDKLVEQAEALYATSPDAVRRMIVAASNPGITAFADAFRLRKD